MKAIGRLGGISFELQRAFYPMFQKCIPVHISDTKNCRVASGMSRIIHLVTWIKAHEFMQRDRILWYSPIKNRTLRPEVTFIERHPE